MDHKVSKDMISSGMIPSGEKTQADLGRIQYGSAPSPSSLMDAYKSIYEHHQKDKDGNTIPHQGEDIQEVLGVVKAGQAAKVNRAMAAKKAMRGAAKKTAQTGQMPKMGAPEKPSSSLMGTVSRGLSSAASAAGRADKAIAARGGLKKMGTDYLKKNKSNIKGALLGKTAAGTATRIGGAYVAGRMMGGDDSNKNNRGLVPTKGFSSYDINFGYTPEGDTLSEDLFDALKSALIEEGYDEKSVMKIMASVTPDLINEVVENYKREENLNELAPLALALPALAKGAAALLAKKAVVGGALKAGALGAKALGKKAVIGATKMAMKKGTTAGATKLVGKVGTQKAAGMVAKKAAVGTGKALAKNPVNTALAGSMLMPQGGAPKPEVAQRAVGTGRRSAGVRTMSLDLFDVVKGKLLDEGLTEEESNDVMTTLTLEEINEVIQLDEISSKLLMKSAKAAEVARGKAAVAGNKQLAIKKLKQGSKFFEKGVEKRRAEGKMGAGYRDGV